MNGIRATRQNPNAGGLPVRRPARQIDTPSKYRRPIPAPAPIHGEGSERKFSFGLGGLATRFSEPKRRAHREPFPSKEHRWGQA